MKHLGLTAQVAALALSAAGGLSAWAQVPPGTAVPNAQFELAETVQLDRADGTILAHLERVKACLADHQWDEAVETLRQVMENTEGKLLGVTPSRFVALGDACQMIVASLPPEALKLYRSRVDPVAERWYRDGMARRDRRLLTSVVQQAFASRWGDKALRALGEMALEAGDFTAARWHWERILPAQPPPGVANTWPGYPDTTLDLAAIRARLVLVSILEGSPDRARDELAQLVRLHPDARGWLGGREVPYAAALGELLTQSGLWPAPQPGPDWPTFAGSASRSQIAPAMVDVGAVAWRVPLPRLARSNVSTVSRLAAVAEDGTMPLGCHPVVAGDHVFISNQQEIVAVRLADGKPAWGGAGSAVYREPLEGLPGAFSNPPDTLGLPRFTLTICDGRLYARMGSAVTSLPQQTASETNTGSLVCLDLEAEGRLVWKVAPEEGWAFEGAPVVAGARLYVAMRHNDIRPQAHVACFDAPTGRPRWRRFICAAETPARGMFPQTTHNLLALEGDTLYYNTNLGAVAALATDDGRIQWVSLYPRARRGDLLRLAPHWQRDLTPCLLDRGTLLVAPADSPRLFALDPPTGQILWHTGTEVEDVVHLLGVAGDQLIASGRKLYWISVRGPDRGQVRHVWPDGQEKPGYGRGALAGHGVLWPTRQKLYVFDQATAQPRKVIDLAPLGMTGGNLVVAGGRLLVATGTELIALGQGASRPARPPELTHNSPSPLRDSHASRP